MTEKRVNPELIKKCAELAFPMYTWIISGRVGMVGCVVRVIVDHDDEELPASYMEFHLQSHPSDREALMLALMDEKNGGWEFGKTRDQFHARRKEGQVTTFMCDTPVGILLMRCVAFESSIPLYLTNPGGDV